MFNSKRLAKEPRQLLTIRHSFVHVWCGTARIRPNIVSGLGEGRMRPNVVSTKLISTKRRPLDVIENSLMLLAVALPQAMQCLKKS